MYVVSKLAQAAGLAVILVGFIQHFPELISLKVFFLGSSLFLCGWLLHRFSRS